MKIKLWIATQEQDSSCYNLIAKTKKELLQQIEKHSHVRYCEIAQVESNFRDAFDMFDWVTSENGGRSIYTFDKIISKSKVVKQ
jgi:hypothetical protein